MMVKKIIVAIILMGLPAKAMSQAEVNAYVTFSFHAIYYIDTETYETIVKSGVVNPAFDITMPLTVKYWWSRNRYVDVGFGFGNGSFVCAFLDVKQHEDYCGSNFENIEDKVVEIDRDMIKEYMSQYPIDSLTEISQSQADSIFLWRMGEEPFRSYRKYIKSAHKRILKPPKYEKIRNKYKNAVLYKPPFLILLYQIKPEEFKYFKRYIGITIHDEDTTLPKSWIEVF